jgi:general secretion pathway protein A
MYLDFYNLRAEPFQITPNPAFLYLSPSHREALATIIYGVEQGKGFMALVGEVGLGKTTLLQAFLQERQGTKEKIIYLFNSRFSYSGLLRALARELDLKPESEDPEGLLDHIYQALIREYARWNSVILLIDEAQGLHEETLEGLRLISNLETPTEKLLQIILVGQPELAAKLDRYELRQLKQRIAVQAVLSPLTWEESREYLRFRLGKVGGRAEDLFTPRALEKIIRWARGIPRALNIVADNALVTGFGYQRKPVTVKVVREVIADLEGRGRPFFSRFSPAVFLLLVLGVLGVLVYYQPPVSGSKVSITLYGEDQVARSTVKGIYRGEISEPAAPITPIKQKGGGSQTPEQPSASVEDRPGQRPESFPFTRRVRKDENLYRMILEVYGNSTPELVDLVRQHNPRIKEDLKILVGQKVIFPERKPIAKNGE